MAEYVTPILQIQSNNGNLVRLNPRTTVDQVVNPKIGQVFGPFVILLRASDWNPTTKQCLMDFSSVLNTDIPFVSCAYNIGGEFAGSNDLQDIREAFNLLDPKWGVEALNGQIRLTCMTEVPKIDFCISVYWTR